MTQNKVWIIGSRSFDDDGHLQTSFYDPEHYYTSLKSATAAAESGNAYARKMYNEEQQRLDDADKKSLDDYNDFALRAWERTVEENAILRKHGYDNADPQRPTAPVPARRYEFETWALKSYGLDVVVPLTKGN